VLSSTGSASAGMVYVIDSTGVLYAFGAQISTPSDGAEADKDDADDTEEESCIKENYCDATPIYNPLLFVHGMGGKPEEWLAGNKRMYRDRLLEEFRKNDSEFPEEWIDSYHFGFLQDGGYNYQGDIAEMASGMTEAVGKLSAAHKEYGGDGKVDLVGFSLGGIIIRQYLADNLTDHHVRKAILMASPNKGSWLMVVDRDVYSIPILGKTLEHAIAGSIVNIVNSIKKYHPISTRSKTAIQVSPKSDYLEGSQKLNDYINTPDDVEYYLHAANIMMRARHNFLYWTIEREASIGDGVVLEESVYGLPLPEGKDIKMLTYGDTNTIEIFLDKAHAIYSYAVDIPELDSWKLFHTEFDKYNELVDDVVAEILE